MVGFSSCLKDTPNFNPDDSNNVTEFANTGAPLADPTSTSAVGYLADLGTMVIGDTSSFKVNISYSGADQAPQDMEVVVDVDQSLLASYNDANDEGFVLPPASVVDLSKIFPATVKIKKGEHRGQLIVPAKLTTDYNFSESYGIPLVIKSTSVGVISGNYGKAVYQVSVRNPYDGVYSIVSGTVTRYNSPGVPANDALSGSLVGNKDVYLVTSGSTSVSFPPVSNDGGLFWAYGNNSMVSGIDGTSATVDPSTNLVTMKSTGSPSLTNWAGHDNYYDPETQTFHLAFIWNPTSTVRTYEMVLKYKGPRD